MAKCPNCGADLENNKCTFCDYVYVPAAVVVENVSDKSKVIAALLCFFLGGFGAHHFYVGKPVMGVVYFVTAGLLGFGSLFDFVCILLGKFKDAKGLYLKK